MKKVIYITLWIALISLVCNIEFVNSFLELALNIVAMFVVFNLIMNTYFSIKRSEKC